MGWEKGKGIGKEMQGRAVPVQALLRKGKGAVGMYGNESMDSKGMPQRRNDLGDYQDEDDESEDISTPHVSQWRKNVSKYVFLSANRI